MNLQILFYFTIFAFENVKYVLSQENPGDGSKQPCGDGSSICVSFYLCNPDGTLNIDGDDMINPRWGSSSVSDNKNKTKPECPSILEKCCSPGIDKSTNVKIQIESNTTIYKNCGRRNSNGLYFKLKADEKKTESEYGEFPWMIAVLKKDSTNKNNFICGGSLISPSVVLTAAHSVNEYKPHQLIVRAGEWDVKSNTDGIIKKQEQDVIEIVTHPEFHQKKLRNDIALLMTMFEFTLTSSINTICLPPPNMEFNSEDCIATGWGKDKFGDEGQYASILNKVLLPSIPNDVCQQSLRKSRLGGWFQLHPSFMCAGGEVGVDVCTGDGGGPLVCPIPGGEKDYYYQAGIISWGIGCNDNLPGVYANVAYLRNWIDETLDSRNFDESYYTPRPKEGVLN